MYINVYIYIHFSFRLLIFLKGKIFQKMIIPVPLEVIGMLNMFKENKKDNKTSSLLLRILLPHFEEIFDEIVVKSVVLTASNSSNTDLNEKEVKYEIQGLVNVYEGGTGEKGGGLAPLGVGDDSSVVIIEWKSSPLGMYI
jgi:hypothetical protein